MDTDQQIQQLAEFIHIEADELGDIEPESLDQMVACLENCRDTNQIRLRDANTRNVIFLGRTRAGKSTALQILKDPFGFAESLQLFSQTKDPRLYSFTMATTEGGVEKNFNINLIDTPGLFEMTKTAGAARDNAEIKHLIMKCIEFNIVTLHCLFFVCSFEAGINQHDVEAIVQLNNLFEGANQQFHLIITRSEGKLPSAQKRIAAQVQMIDALKPFLSQGVKIFFLGSNHVDDFENCVYDAVKSKTNNVLRQRTELFRHIFDSSEACHIKNMQVFKETNKQIEDHAQEIRELTQTLMAWSGPEEEAEVKREQLRVMNDGFRAAVGKLAAVTSKTKLDEYQQVSEKAEVVGKLKL